jgi:hypothetical protein
MSQKCRLCCKSRKLQGSKFFAKTQSGRQSLIRITSFALAKSPMSLTQGDEVPHVLTRKSRLQPAEFLITSAKRLLQHNRHFCDMPRSRTEVRFRQKSGHVAPSPAAPPRLAYCISEKRTYLRGFAAMSDAAFSMPATSTSCGGRDFEPATAIAIMPAAKIDPITALAFSQRLKVARSSGNWVLYCSRILPMPMTHLSDESCPSRTPLLTH